MNNFVAEIAISKDKTSYFKSCHINLFTNSEPIIESSDELIFAPYNFAYEDLKDHFRNANLNVSITTWIIFQIVENPWKRIFDMTPVEGERHWRPAEKEEFKPELKNVDELIVPYSNVRVFITKI